MTEEKTARKFPKRKNEIIAALSAELRTMPSGSRLPSNLELSRRFHCAGMTVTRALGELELRGDIFRVGRKGTFVSCRELRDVYVLIPAPGGRNANSIYDRVIREAERRGIAAHMVYATTDNVPSHIDHASVERIPAGSAVIVTGHWYHHVFRFLAERRCKVVYFDAFWDLASQVDSEFAMNWNRLVVPIRLAISEAVRLLAARNHRNILFLHRCVHCNTMGIRAFREALQHEDIPVRPDWEMYGEDNYQTLYENLTRRLYELPDCNAVLTRYSLQAEAAAAVLGRLKRRVPRDCSVISLEDHPRLLACNPPVTVVSAMPGNAAATALDMLTAGGAVPQHETLNFEMVDRGSV